MDFDLLNALDRVKFSEAEEAQTNDNASDPNAENIKLLKNMTDDEFLKRINTLLQNKKASQQFSQLMGQKNFNEALKAVFPNSYEQLSSGTTNINKAQQVNVISKTLTKAFNKGGTQANV